MTSLLLIAAGLVGVGAASDTGADAALVRLTIRAVAATQKDAPNDPRLAAIAGSLDDFASHVVEADDGLVRLALDGLDE